MAGAPSQGLLLAPSGARLLPPASGGTAFDGHDLPKQTAGPLSALALRAGPQRHVEPGAFLVPGLRQAQCGGALVILQPRHWTLACQLRVGGPLVTSLRGHALGEVPGWAHSPPGQRPPGRAPALRRAQRVCCSGLCLPLGGGC